MYEFYFPRKIYKLYKNFNEKSDEDARTTIRCHPLHYIKRKQILKGLGGKEIVLYCKGKDEEGDSSIIRVDKFTIKRRAVADRVLTTHIILKYALWIGPMLKDLSKQTELQHIKQYWKVSNLMDHNQISFPLPNSKRTNVIYPVQISNIGNAMEEVISPLSFSTIYRYAFSKYLTELPDTITPPPMKKELLTLCGVFEENLQTISKVLNGKLEDISSRKHSPEEFIMEMFEEDRVLNTNTILFSQRVMVAGFGLREVFSVINVLLKEKAIVEISDGEFMKKEQ